MHECSLSRLTSFVFFFFFSSRRRHTRYIGDWSSDVCSSDLELRGAHAQHWPPFLMVQQFGLLVYPACSIVEPEVTVVARTLPSLIVNLRPVMLPSVARSEERRVGKGCRSRWSAACEEEK